MKRKLMVGALVAIGAFSLAVAAAPQGQAPAAGQPAAGGQAPNPNAPKVIDAQKVADNLYMFVGGGGNSGVLITGDGVVVVDTKNPGWGQTILDKIKTLTDKPVKMVINTHTHGDHTSGQVEFPPSVDIVAHELTNVNMRKTAPPWDARMALFTQGDNGRMRPKRTFKDRMTIGSGNERIELYFFGRAHTDGDAWVLFPAQHVLQAGDMFANKTPPRIDPDNNGTALEYVNVLSRAINELSNAGVEKVISGHGTTVMTWNDFKEYLEYNRELLAWARSEYNSGKTVDAAAEEYKIPEKWQGYRIMYPVKQYLQSAYDDWKKTATQ